MLKIAAKHSGEAHPGRRITGEMGESDILTLNIRADSGEANAWRDYQQSFAEVGAIYSTSLTGGKVVVTPMGQALLEGGLTYEQFLTVQALGYQYPNGEKRVLQANVKQALRGTGLAGLPTLIDVQLRSGVRLKPFLLCLQVLRQLALLGETPYLTRDEIQRFLAYEATNDRPRTVARSIVGCRKSGGRPPPPVGRSRNFSDVVSFLGRTSVFKDGGLPSPSIALRDSTEEVAAAADKMIEAELSPSACFTFRSGSLGESRRWFAHYGSLERADRLLDPVSVSKQVAQDDLFDDAAVASDVSGEPELSEIRAGPGLGRPLAAPRAPSSPAETAMLREKARRGHKELVNLMADKIKAAGGTPKDNPKTVDVFTELGGRRYYFEMKTVNRVNLLSQVRRGISQLYE